MRKYFFSIILVSISLGQDDTGNDLLILKAGAKYTGKYVGKEGDKVIFKPNDVSSFRPRKLNEIDLLNVDGIPIIHNGNWVDNSAKEIEQKKKKEAFKKILKEVL